MPNFFKKMIRTIFLKKLVYKHVAAGLTDRTNDKKTYYTRLSCEIRLNSVTNELYYHIFTKEVV